MWQGFIPQQENPHMKNPARGFLESANQRPVDSTYPYFIPGSYITPRAVTITNQLSAMSGITPADMMKLQNNYFNTLAEDIRPTLLHFIREQDLNEKEKKYLDIFRSWDLLATPDTKGQSVYQVWFDSLEVEIWNDELSQVNPRGPWPEEQTLMEVLKRDSNFRFIDNINTTAIETLADVVTTAFHKAAVRLSEFESKGGMEWWRINKAAVYHVSDASKSKLLPLARTGLHMGGYGNIVNAVKAASAKMGS